MARKRIQVEAETKPKTGGFSLLTGDKGSSLGDLIEPFFEPDPISAALGAAMGIKDDRPLEDAPFKWATVACYADGSGIAVYRYKTRKKAEAERTRLMTYDKGPLSIRRPHVLVLPLRALWAALVDVAAKTP